MAPAAHPAAVSVSRRRVSTRSEPTCDGQQLDALLTSTDAMSRRRVVLAWAAEQSSVDEVVTGLVAARRRLADGPREIRPIAEEVDELLREAVRLFTERALRTALTDPLTGLGTRRAFVDGLAAALATADHANEPMLVVLADIDGLKRINDTAGHAAGDDVIRNFAGAVTRFLRVGDAAYRIGGDEIVMLLPGANVDAVAAMRLRLASMGAPAASLGWALYPDEARDPQRLLEIADSRLYSSKRSSRRARRTSRDLFMRLGYVLVATAVAASGATSFVALQAHHRASAPAVRSPSAPAPTVKPPAASRTKPRRHVTPRPPSAHTKGPRALRSFDVTAVDGRPAPPLTVTVPLPVPAPTAIVPTLPETPPTPGPIQPVASVVRGTVDGLLCALLCPK